MMKKETIDTHKEDTEENVKGTDKVEGTEVTEENKVEPITDEEVKSEAGETKRKKISKEKELESKLKEQHDKYLRLAAEFDNYRKRTMKERIELTQYVSTELITRILPVIDDFERAIDSMRSTQDIDVVRQGIELLFKKFKHYLNEQR